MQVTFSEREFREIGEAYVERMENDDVDGKQTVSFYEDGENDAQDRDDRLVRARMWENDNE